MRMHNPRPQFTGAGGIGVGLLTFVVDKLSPHGLRPGALYALGFVAIMLIFWAIGTYIVGLIRHAKSRGGSVWPIAGMVISGIAFLTCLGWYLIDQQSVLSMSDNGNIIHGISPPLSASSTNPTSPVTQSGGQSAETIVNNGPVYNAPVGNRMPESHITEEAKTHMLMTITHLMDEYAKMHPGEANILRSRPSSAFIKWVNQQLAELGENWHVSKIPEAAGINVSGAKFGVIITAGDNIHFEGAKIRAQTPVSISGGTNIYFNDSDIESTK